MLIQYKNQFPVLVIDRDEVEHVLGFDPELTDEQMEILAAALHDAIREKGFQQLLEDILDDLEKALGIVVPGDRHNHRRLPMPKLKLYALALTAEKWEEYQLRRTITKSAVYIARDADHAVDKGIAKAKELWPFRGEFWSGHAVHATEVPCWMIVKAYNQEVTND